jgi:hypothetical protein
VSLGGGAAKLKQTAGRRKLHVLSNAAIAGQLQSSPPPLLLLLLLLLQGPWGQAALLWYGWPSVSLLPAATRVTLLASSRAHVSSYQHPLPQNTTCLSQLLI